MFVGLPPPVVTLTVLVVIPAVDAMVKVAVSVLESTTVMPLTMTPEPETVILVPVGVKFEPIRVTATAVPRAPLLGFTEVRTGSGGVT